jgi:hypothetical protein
MTCERERLNVQNNNVFVAKATSAIAADFRLPTGFHLPRMHQLLYFMAFWVFGPLACLVFGPSAFLVCGSLAFLGFGSFFVFCQSSPFLLMKR